ncbi:MAG TPA: hypothetical protein VLT45_09230 [Kofleriaceae bacterium]|nr:hypothetical protein [Kofleriaceae bacterium]
MRRVLALACILAGCGTDDPCAASKGSCVTVHVTSPTIARIDELQLDVLYGTYHATVSDPVKKPVALPVQAAVELALPGTLAVSIDAGGLLGGTLLGTGTGKLTVMEGEHASLDIVIVPQQACVAGSRYCGGDKVAGDPSTLYECVANGVPKAHGVCPGACVIRTASDDECAAVGGPCTSGGLYCGGDKLTGDPSSLYQCTSGAPTFVMACENGCVINPSPTKDACR